MTKFRTKFTLLDIKQTRLRRVRTEINIAAVSASVNDDHYFVLRKDLVVKPFKIQLVQELKPNELPQRRIFGE